MTTSVLSSTFLLVLLLMVGLVFFIRASVKDRTQAAKFASPQPEELLVLQLQQHFVQRAYRVANTNAESNYAEFEGIVRPSVFLSLFLLLLAAIGLLCLALVLSLLLPNSLWVTFLLVLLSPIASVFYWRNAKRLETVKFKVESANGNAASIHQSIVTITAHRDELLELQQALLLTPTD